MILAIYEEDKLDMKLDMNGDVKRTIECLLINYIIFF